MVREGPVFTHILLADEINRATPRTQAALLECMAENQVTSDGVTRPLDPPFFVIATENPVETYGCFPLPEAQLDRFLMKLSMGSLSADAERKMLDRFMEDEPLTSLQPVVTLQDVLSLREQCLKIYVHPDLRDYMVSLAQKSRSVARAGVSPRGTLALLRASRGYAMVQGRDFVTPEDIQAVALPVLVHRWIGSETDTVRESGLRQLLRTVSVPTEDWEKR